MQNDQIDEFIVDHVERYGLKDWDQLAARVESALPGASMNGRKARERWQHHLDPRVHHGVWTHQEDVRMVELFHKSRGSWSIMAISMPGRTDVQIRNRWGTKPFQEYLAKVGMPTRNSPPGPGSPSDGKRPRSTVTVAVSDAPPRAGVGKVLKVVIGGSVKFDSPSCDSPFGTINKMMKKLPDARNQKWDGFGKN